MFIIMLFLFLMIIMDIAAMRWGFSSNDGLESKEWEHRRHYAGIE